MSTQAISVVGTPQGFWTQRVQQMLSRLEHAGVHAEPSSSDAQEGVLRAPVPSRTLVLVEHPAVGLARMLVDDTVQAPQAWLDEWLSNGRALLAHAQRDPSACLLVNADDARRHPQKLAAMLRDAWGESPTLPAEATTVHRPDPLVTALAASFVDQHLSVQEVADELLASCVILPGEEPLITTLSPRGLGDGAAASRRLVELLKSERALAQTVDALESARETMRNDVAAGVEQGARLAQSVEAFVAERDALRSELERATAAHRDSQLSSSALKFERDLHAGRAEEVARQLGAEQERTKAQVQENLGLRMQIAALGDERVRIERDLCESREWGERHLQQLQQVQEDLKRTFLAHQESEATLSAAKAEGELRQQELQQVHKELERVTAAQRTAETALQALKASPDGRKLEQELRAAKEEGELLLQQLHQVQEELERMFLAKHDAENARLAAKAGPDAKKLEQDLRNSREECELLTLQMNQVQQELERVHQGKVRNAREAKARIALPGLDDLAIGHVVVVGERDTAPHREVSFVVRDVRAGARQVAEATVRLVEHWGRPGLAIFADEGRAPMFESWRESGREDGRPYMLLIHGEDSAQRVYDAMGTLDWQLLQAVAASLLQALQDAECSASPAWRSLAQRLLTSLQEQPARLRYEAVRVMPIAQESPEVARWGLVLERANYRGRTWPRLTIQWRPTGPRPSIELVKDEESGPPLLAWPADEDGVPVRALRLLFGEDPNAPEIRAAWDALSGPDRNFVADILNLIPILAVHVQAASTSAAGPAVDLQTAAKNTVLLGRAALQPPPVAPPSVAAGQRLLQRVARRLRASVTPGVTQAVATESNR